jgi:hypothetical protein
MTNQDGKWDWIQVRNWNRKVWATAYLGVGFVIIAALLILHFIGRQKVFCVESEMTGWSYFYRFLWCISFASFGLVAIAYYWHLKNNRSPTWPIYCTGYPLQLLIVASLMLGLLHFWERTSGYTFYYLSSSICFVLGFTVDYHLSMVINILNKGLQRLKQG